MTFAEFLSREPERVRKRLRLMFAGFSDMAVVRVAHLAAGQAIMRQGDAESDIYLLLAGRLSVIAHASCATYAMREFRPYALVGEPEALANHPYIVATVQAKTKCRVLVISHADYVRWVLSDRDIMLKRMRDTIATLLQQGTQDRAALFLRSADRMAMFLTNYYEQKRPDAPEGDGVVVVRMSHTAIAEEIGFSLRTINRCVQRLHAQGLVGLDRGKMFLTQAQCDALAATLPVQIPHKR